MGIGLLVVGWVGIAGVAQAGTWQPRQGLQASFVTASPPEAPSLAENAAGHAIAAWDDTGSIRFSERVAGGTWTAGANVRRGATGGPVDVAIGPDETAAVAWVTVGTEFVPAYLVASVRAPGATFAPPLVIGPGAGVWSFDVAVEGDGTVLVAWADGLGVEVSALAPGAAAWSAAVLVSDTGVGANAPDLAVDDAGDAVVVWSQGGFPGTVGSARLLAGAGAWELPVIVSTPGADAWSPAVGVDAAGDAFAAFVEDGALVTASRPAAGAWTAPVGASDPNQVVVAGALGVSAAGGVVVAWEALDAGGMGSVWSASAAPGGAFGAPVKLSRAAEDAGPPSAALSDDGAVAVIAWVDDVAIAAKAATGTGAPGAFAWSRATLGEASWGSVVPVAAGGGAAAASWATQSKANPNLAKILGRAWE